MFPSSYFEYVLSLLLGLRKRMKPEDHRRLYEIAEIMGRQFTIASGYLLQSSQL